MASQETVLEKGNLRLYTRYYTGKTAGPLLVFLHGYSFTSHVWAEIRLLQRLEDRGIPYVAPDMPYGMRVEKTRPKTTSVKTNLSALELLLERFDARDRGYMIVGASLGGYLALEHLASGGEPSAMVLVAPVRTHLDHIRDALRSYGGPILYIWGSKDNIVDREELEEAASLSPRARLVVYEGARHPAYLDEPERFARDVLDLYAEAAGL